MALPIGFVIDFVHLRDYLHQHGSRHLYMHGISIGSWFGGSRAKLEGCMASKRFIHAVAAGLSLSLSGTAWSSLLLSVLVSVSPSFSASGVPRRELPLLLQALPLTHSASLVLLLLCVVFMFLPDAYLFLKTKTLLYLPPFI